ncbi:MAG: type I methionyl aminopeptidase [bacterium]|nr:type I methionyl aminopeptidase [bacterium]
MSARRQMIPVKSPDDVARMREACRIVAATTKEVLRLARPGVTTGALDACAARLISAAGATPTFKGYRGFPGSICVSINDELIHGIPGPRVICPGDIVSVDIGVTYRGMIGDMARTVCVGAVPGDVAALVAGVREALEGACRMLRAGICVGDLSHALQGYADAHGYGVVRDYVGHGVGAALHEPPQIPNFGARGSGMVIPAGATLAIEPMFTLGDYRVRVLGDKWTVVTHDGAPCAHYENTVLVTDGGCEVLTVDPA